ncbi:hypothetical protein R69746_05999 [Paraburkholderia aspalathi]|nr:hypothetical protein R69746_05999 [Paraburkholderia aspalathi]
MTTASDAGLILYMKTIAFVFLFIYICVYT